MKPSKLKYRIKEEIRKLYEQDPGDDDWDLEDDTILDDVVVVDDYGWDPTSPISLDSTNNQDYIDNWCEYFPNSFGCSDISIDDSFYPSYMPTEPIPDGMYWSMQCDAYGCMDPDAYNYNAAAGPFPWCWTYCHYNQPLNYNDQNWATEANHCTQMGTHIGGSWYPCHVNNGFTYNTIPYAGAPGTGGGNVINNYVVQCCQAGYQYCDTQYGCLGEVEDDVLNDDYGPDTISDDDIPDEFQTCNAENSGCRAPQWGNFSPDHFCDCNSIYFGPPCAPGNITAGCNPQQGDTSCCNHNPLDYLPTSCVEQLNQSIQAQAMDNWDGVLWDSSCWENQGGINPWWTIDELSYHLDYIDAHPGVGDTDSTIVPQAPCFYGCNDPLAGNYDPDATCSSFPHCRNHPDCGNCMYYTTAPEPEQDEEKPEKPEVSLVRPEKPETSPTEPVSGETKTKIKKYSIDYVPDSETPIDKSLMEEIERIKKLLL
tara:strand:+ start:2253 stop:3698 length:1446 start_codon:yes stop_codon:yes gene_type:complete